MRLLIFVFFFLSSTLSCFAYDIQPYSEEQLDKTKAALNLVFYALNYPEEQDSSEDIDVILESLKKTKPFDEFNNFAIWYANLPKEEKNSIFKSTPGFPPLKVRQDFLDYISERLKSNYKLIIIDYSGSLSCAELSSIDKLSLIILGRKRYTSSGSFAKGFLHELGHSLGLREECVRCNQLCAPGPPNCATTQEDAQEWWGDLAKNYSRVRFINGCCGNKDYIRPTIASLMNNTDKAGDFGPVNERFLREELGLSTPDK
ncbi:hypothetical protein ACFL1D_00715 [Candidatus Omnitrophota bacterium]